MSVSVDGHVCFKSEPITTKFGIDLHNVNGEDLVWSNVQNHPRDQHQWVKTCVRCVKSSNLYRGHIYAPIQTKYGINLRNTSGRVLGWLRIFLSAGVGAVVGQNLYRDHSYGQIQTKYDMKIRNTTLDVLGSNFLYHPRGQDLGENLYIINNIKGHI
jgi:hypothetical protein